MTFGVILCVLLAVFIYQNQPKLRI